MGNQNRSRRSCHTLRVLMHIAGFMTLWRGFGMIVRAYGLEKSSSGCPWGPVTL